MKQHQDKHQQVQHQQHNHRWLKEGLEIGDLARLVHNEMHIDEYKSKMGNDEDMVVASFKVGGKDPAIDLVNFIEKGYDWIIDADTSAGEMDDGDYIVFVEMERTPRVPAQIMELLEDLVGLTENQVGNWRVRYYKNPADHECTLEDLKAMIPATPADYLKRVSKDTEAIDKLKAESGIKIDTTAPKNDFTESLRIAAGIL
jgi:hypothetical protein